MLQTSESEKEEKRIESLKKKIRLTEHFNMYE
jgi:hypothetical protein